MALRLANTERLAERMRAEAARESERRLEADLDATKGLVKLGLLFARKGDLKPVLTAVVDAAITICGADFGNVQLLDADSAELRIVAQRGFPKWWIEFWNTTCEGRGGCGTALEQGRPVIVEDVEQSPIFAGTRALRMQLKAGVRAVQSTPLLSRSGKVLGMFSTHYKTAHRPDERTLGLLDLLARQASDLIERAQAEEKLNQLNATLERRVAERTEELARVNQLLRCSEQALAAFFSEAPLGLLWVAPDGHIVRANQAQAALLGCSFGELLCRNLAEFCTDRETVFTMLRELAEGKSIQEHPLRLLRRDCSIRHVLVDANGAWRDRMLTHSRWFLRDVSQRVELEREILDIGERVRRQIGHDLHDDLCQQLTSIEYLGRALERQLSANSQVCAERARELGSLTRQAIAYTRELSHTMSPVELVTDGLAAALKHLAARTKRLFHIDCRFRGDSGVLLDDSAVLTNLYRIAQEATQNAIKHGKARRIQIGLTEKEGRIFLRVRDDGVGVPLKLRKKNGFGLRIMDYRASALGGSLTVQKPKSGGTSLVCSIPKALTIPIKQQPRAGYVR